MTEDIVKPSDAWLAEDPLPSDPVEVVDRWLAEAFDARLQQNPNAIALATLGERGHPEVRMVLCNMIDVARGEFTMYTNRSSPKGRALLAHPQAAFVFYWAPQSRQVRIEGRVRETSPDEADAYFSTRPLEAKLGAWASAQSEPIASRANLVAKLSEQAARFGVDTQSAENRDIPRPPHWGGFTLLADSIELWVSRVGRLHDRVRWQRSLEPDPGPWRSCRLQP